MDEKLNEKYIFLSTSFTFCFFLLVTYSSFSYIFFSNVPFVFFYNSFGAMDVGSDVQIPRFAISA